MLWEAAGVGHRITHEDDLPEPKELQVKLAKAQLVGLDLGSASAGSELGFHFSRPLAQQLQLDGDDPGEAPDPTGTIERGSVDTFIGVDLRAAAIAHEDIDVDCENDSDGPIAQGAMHVYVNRVPWARRNDELECGARIGEGEPTILIGGEPTPTAERTATDMVVDKRVLGAVYGSHPSFGSSHAAELGKRLSGASGARRSQQKMSGTDIGAKLAQGQLDHVAMSLSRGR